VPLPREAKLAAALRELQKEEAERLRWFEQAKKSGEPFAHLGLSRFQSVWYVRQV